MFIFTEKISFCLYNLILTSHCLLPNVCFYCLCLWNHQTSSPRDSVLGIAWIIILIFCRHIYDSSERYTLKHNPPRNPELFSSFPSQTLPNLISLPMASQVVPVVGNLPTNADWSDLGYTYENKYYTLVFLSLSGYYIVRQKHCSQRLVFTTQPSQ